ncbi:hypothetical protein ZHAS_00013111 [Anopheles sinensis]|uniref:Uncharacterized protein n=1 Tax=Anopheles sinensis TaxID=74873 RepID=A0A084W4L1_ANOSI|nr:hypothetical protein ZHAS_00013111 [Anopheles sinensis]
MNQSLRDAIINARAFASTHQPRPLHPGTAFGRNQEGRHHRSGWRRMRLTNANNNYPLSEWRERRDQGERLVAATTTAAAAAAATAATSAKRTTVNERAPN